MTGSGFAAFVNEQIGRWCYVYGGNGQDMTAMGAAAREAWIARREKDPENRARVKKLYEKLIGAGVDPVRGGDCSGFVCWCAHECGLFTGDKNAAGLYAYCEKTESPVQGDLCFRLDKDGRAVHTGVFDGNAFIHCKGRDEGVVRDKSAWHAFGRLPALKSGERRVLILGSVHVRQAPSKDSASLYIAHAGDSLPLIDDGYRDTRGGRWYAVECTRPGAKLGRAYVSAFTFAKNKYTKVTG